METHRLEVTFEIVFMNFAKTQKSLPHSFRNVIFVVCDSVVSALYTNVYRRSTFHGFKCTLTYELIDFEYIALITVAKMCT